MKTGNAPTKPRCALSAYASDGGEGYKKRLWKLGVLVVEAGDYRLSRQQKEAVVSIGEMLYGINQY